MATADEQSFKPVPARGYSWEPFEKGHTASMRHGAHSPRVFGPLAQAAYEWLVEQAENEGLDWALKPTFSIALESIAQTIAQVYLLRAHLADAHGTGQCDRESCSSQLIAFERLLDRRLETMGFTPVSRARLEKDLAVGTATLQRAFAEHVEHGRKLRAAADDEHAREGDSA